MNKLVGKSWRGIKREKGEGLGKIRGVELNWLRNWSMKYTMRRRTNLNRIEHILVRNNNNNHQLRINEKMKKLYLRPFESGLEDSLHSSSVP